jgi:ribose/xylose/arabinose/galactoside ABC-type transport system permease subunit
MWASLGVILTSGVMLFLSEALKSFGNEGFQVKMVLLFLALVVVQAQFLSPKSRRGNQEHHAGNENRAFRQLDIWGGAHLCA